MAIKKQYPSKLAANGQIVVPKELRDSIGVKGGDTIVFVIEESPTGGIKISLSRPQINFSSLVGVCSSLKGRPLKTILKELDDEDME